MFNALSVRLQAIVLQNMYLYRLKFICTNQYLYQWITKLVLDYSIHEIVSRIIGVTPYPYIVKFLVYYTCSLHYVRLYSTVFSWQHTLVACYEVDHGFVELWLRMLRMLGCNSCSVMIYTVTNSVSYIRTYRPYKGP